MPGSEIQRALKEQQDHFVALSRIGDSFAGQFRQMQSIADSMRPSLVLGEGLMAYTERTANMARLVDDMCAPYESVRQLLLPTMRKSAKLLNAFRPTRLPSGCPTTPSIRYQPSIFRLKNSTNSLSN